MTTDVEYPPGPSYRMPNKLFHEFIRDPIKTLTSIAREYGDISHFKLGRQHLYLINNPDYIEKVLIYDHRNFKKGKRLQVAKGLLGEGLVTSEGDFHKRQRRLIQPIFHPKQIKNYGKIITDYANRIQERWNDGDTLDIQKEMMQLTLSIICKSVLNYDIETETQEVAKALTVCRNYSKRLQNPIGHVLNKIPILPKVRGAQKAKKILDTLVYGLIEERREKENDTPHEDKKYDDLLTKLLHAQDTTESETDIKMSDSQIRDEVMTIFIAGHETTANALTWTFYLLSQNPIIEKQLHAELDCILRDKDGKNRIPTVEDIPKLLYTEKVFRESMRLYPPIWSIGRYVDYNYTVGNYTIPIGSTLLMSQYVMHHDPRYFSEPEQFNPSRWTEEFRAHLPRFSYFPFGGGIRGCIGESFAWMEGILVIATIAQNWVFRLVPHQHVELDPMITLRPKYGMKMALSSRK